MIHIKDKNHCRNSSRRFLDFKSLWRFSISLCNWYKQNNFEKSSFLFPSTPHKRVCTSILTHKHPSTISLCFNLEKKIKIVKFGQLSKSYRNGQFPIMLNYSLDFPLNIEGNKFILWGNWRSYKVFGTDHVWNLSESVSLSECLKYQIV